MYEKILIPTDGSALGHVLMASGVDLARSLGASIVGFAVAPTFRQPLLAAAAGDHEAREHDYRSSTDRALEKLLKKMQAIADQAGVPFVASSVVSDHAAREIIVAAHRHHCDLIFMASHGRHGFARLFHRSITAQVVAQSDLPVTVEQITPEAMARYNNAIDPFAWDAVHSRANRVS